MMRNFIPLILLLVLLIPATSRAAAIDYALEVRIDTDERKINGAAAIHADIDTELTLSVGRLFNVKVNGSAVVGDLNDTIALTVGPDRKTVVTYEASVQHTEDSLIDAAHVSLSGNWYPLPDALVTYRLTAVLPQTFVAVAEAEFIRSQNDDGTVTYRFHFDHPLDRLHLVASNRYTVVRDSYKNIALEAYFFHEDSALAATYLAHAKRHLQMYEAMLTPYPYRRFAIVEHPLPTGNAMPTFTLLGEDVVRLPFIVRTSLAHEILHQWLGSSVYIDLSQGNWAEGLTSYLADHQLALLEDRAKEYRKQILVDYAAYVRPENSLSLDTFFFSGNKAQAAVGYGKAAMLFHDLRMRLGDPHFFAALQHFIQEHRYARASWRDVRTSFETITGRDLSAYFDRWLHPSDIPRLEVTEAALAPENGELKIKLSLRQQSPPFPLRIPVSLYFEKGARIHFIEMNAAQKTVLLPIQDLPTRVVVDEGYDIMRQLAPEEMPPVLAAIMGGDALTVAVSQAEKAVYEPLVEALGVPHANWVSPDQLVLSTFKGSPLLIAGRNNDLLKELAGSAPRPQEGAWLKVIHNPYNPSQPVLMADVSQAAEAGSIQKKLRHYGNYSELAFNQGTLSRKQVVQAENGISAWQQPTPKAVRPDRLPSLERIVPELAQSAVIYVGERHDQFAHHVNQLLIIQKLKESGLQLAVGMEMFKQPHQGVIEDFMAGRIDEREFLGATRYFSEWGYNYHLYKPIVDYLKQQGIPLVALNLENDITRRVARNGLASLAADEKQKLPESLDFTNEPYRRDLEHVYAFHEGRSEAGTFNHFMQAQVLWDEAMAEAADAFLQAEPHRTLVVLAGNGHLKYGYGIPQRLFRRNQKPYVVVLQDEALDSHIADYVLTGEALAVQEAPRLGITIREKKDGLKIRSVVDKSPAQEAGLQKNDVIQQFDASAVVSLADLRLVLFYAATGRTYDMAVQRGDEKLNLKIRLFDMHSSAAAP